jgi:hypothetical protein
MVLVPLVFFRHARSLWLAIGVLASALDDRTGRGAGGGARGTRPTRRPP